MKKQVEKIKVPSLKLKWAVIERHWRGDKHPGCERLCSYDRLVATFDSRLDADADVGHRQSRQEGLFANNPAHEFQVIETSKLKAAKN